MYSSGYSKYSPQAQKKMQYRSKGKSCGYYMRIVFFFSSLIQSLIIVSLVLFLIYGKKQDSASISRVQDLEESFSRLSIENVALRQQRKNLTTLLNVTLTEKARNDWDLARLRHFSNISMALLQDADKKMQQCNTELFFCKASPRSPGISLQTQTVGGCNCGLLVEQLRARLELVDSNFTQTAQRMRTDIDRIAKERDNLNLEAIRLRRDKSTHEKEVQIYRQRCKEDFTLSLSGVSNVTKAFLEKVDSLFPTHIAFQLTCPKQREHLEQIRTNCTSLSREVEDKFQRYLNSVGEQVSSIQGENSRLKAENWRLSDDYRWCSQNRTGLIREHRQNLDKLQQKNDEDKERLLIDKMRLNGDIQVLESNVKYKNKEVEHLREQLRQLNMTCMAKVGYGGFPGGTTSRGSTSNNGWNMFGGGGSSSASSSSNTFGQASRTGLGSSLGSTGTGSSSSSLFPSGSGSSIGSGLNKYGSSGTGSSSSSLFPSGSGSSTGLGLNRFGSSGTGSSSTSLFSSGSGSSTGSGLNKFGSSGTGSSSTSLFSSGSGSSTGSGLNKPGSTGTGSSSTSLFSSGSGSSTGSGLNKPGSTGTGSSSTSLFSSGSGSSTGLGLNKPGSTGTGSSSTSLFSSGSASSTGSGVSKPGSTGGGFFGTGSNPSLSSSGTGSNKPVLGGRGSSTTGTSSGSTGSSSSYGSSGSSLSKPATNAKSSSGVGSSSGSTGSTSKSGSLSWFGFGSNNSPSKPGSGTGKGTSSGGGFGGAGSSGRTSGFVSGPVSIAQHLQDLQRLINPPGPEDKQDLSRMMG